MDFFGTSSTLEMRRKHFFHSDLVGGETRNYGEKIWEARHHRIISIIAV